VEKSKGGTFPLRLEIRKSADFHFYHSPGDDELSFRSDSGKK
jgi:hypothetical protein